MTIVGGLRARLLYDSLKAEIERSLEELGWFDSGRSHLPVTFRTTPVDWDEEVAFNTLVLFAEDRSTDPQELGSNLAEHRRTFYLDFYAENESVGEHMIFDLQDILEGRMSSIGRDSSYFDLMDYTLATPTAFASAEIEESVTVDRSMAWSNPWQKYWFSCQFIVIDRYGDEDD